MNTEGFLATVRSQYGTIVAEKCRELIPEMRDSSAMAIVARGLSELGIIRDVDEEVLASIRFNSRPVLRYRDGHGRTTSNVSQ